MTELQMLLSDITLSVLPAVVVVNFNINYDDHSKADTLIEILDTFGLIQYGTTPTYTYMLDLVTVGLLSDVS